MTVHSRQKLNLLYKPANAYKKLFHCIYPALVQALLGLANITQSACRKALDNEYPDVEWAKVSIKPLRYIMELAVYHYAIQHLSNCAHRLIFKRVFLR